MELFDCEKLSARLTKNSCAERHLSGNFLTCKDCELGALHAGKAIQAEIPKYLCLRCRRTASRLIRGALCPSCDNRDRELKRGRNARGNKPVRLKPLHVGTVGYISTDGNIAYVELSVVDNLEIALRISKLSRDGICGFRAPVPPGYLENLENIKNEN